MTNTVSGWPENTEFAQNSLNAPEQFLYPDGEDPIYVASVTDAVDIGSHTFSAVGTYWYYCSIGSHAANGMIGKIIVNE